MRKLVLLLVVLALPVSLAASGRTPLPSTPTRYVTDAPDVIRVDREADLNERLAQFERDTTHQVIVYIDRSIPEGTTLEEMSAEAIRTWAVGQTKRDNGAILFLFLDSHDSRIEVGYGLEGTLTDAISKRILVEMRPLLRNGDYAGAVEQGAEAILATIASEPPAAVQPVVEVEQYAPVVERQSDFGPGCVGPLGFLLLLFFVIANAVQHGSRIEWNTRGNDDAAPFHPWHSSSNDASFSSGSTSSHWSSGSGASSSPSSSSPSSSFHGGGGSGGGGGASDKW